MYPYDYGTFEADIATIIGVYAVLAIIFLGGFLINYVIKGIAYMKLAKQRGMDKPWLAWVPFANTYLVGATADHINAQYQKHTKRGMTMLVLDIISSLISIVTLIIFFNTLVDIYDQRHLIDTVYGIDLEVSILITGLLLLLVVMAAAIWLTVLTYMSEYTVFKEYAPSNAGLFIALSVLGSVIFGITFIAPIIILCIYKNVPQFTVLNTRSTYQQNPYANYNQQYGQPYQQQYQQPQQPYQQPYQQPQQPYQQPQAPQQPSEPPEQPEQSDDGPEND